jgi:thymidylate kinase
VVSRLDVVAELAAHQQNLAPDGVALRSVVLALPPPVVATLIAPDWTAVARGGALRAVAEAAGGGDGPLAIVELAGDFTAELARLWQRGVRTLVVFGAREQPGHARALAYRWPGALQLAGESWLDPLLDPAESTRVLASGVVRVAPGVAAPAGYARVLAAVDGAGDPRRVAEQGPQVWPYAVDAARRLGAWSGVAPPDARFGTACGAELRARWDAWWTARGHPELVRAAVLGLDPVLEAALHVPAPRPAPRRARVLAITGIDGAGKSSHVARLARTLCDRGARVRVIKLYRQGAFLELANQLGARTRRGAPLAAFRVSRVVKLIDSLRVYRDHVTPALAACDAVLFDRYVETHLAAAESQLGWDLTGHPALVPFPPADLRWWLALDPTVALERREARGEPASADEHAVGLHGYARVFGRLAALPGEIVLDATAAESANAHAIAERALALVSAARREPGAHDDHASLVPAAAPARVRAAAPCAVHVGLDPTRSSLGDDALRLRGELAGWCGAAAAGVPEAFWLEAYAAQLVIDAMTQAPSQAAVALWPSALAAMAHHELDMLAELERVLAPLVQVVSYDPRAETYEDTFRALGATEAAAHRLARDYAVQLERIAGERGWSRAVTASPASAAAPSAPAS